MNALSGKVVVVTGAGRGLGRAYATDAARHGATVVVNDIDADAAAAVVAEITANGGVAVDNHDSIASWGGSASIIETTLQSFGRLDGLVNNAGVLSLVEPWNEDEASVRRKVEVNLIGSIFMGTHAMRVMMDQGSGAIVNVTSSAQLGLSTMGVYGATKGGLASLTYSWAIDLQPYSVRVNAYSPVAKTAMTDQSPVLPSVLPSAEDNAPAVTYLLSDLSDGITGQVVQRRDNSLVVMSHPSLSEYRATCEGWTVDSVNELFGPVLREHMAPVGFAVSSA